MLVQAVTHIKKNSAPAIWSKLASAELTVKNLSSRQLIFSFWPYLWPL